MNTLSKVLSEMGISAEVRERPDYRTLDVAFCRSCSGVLDFQTNGIGQVIESCDRCGTRGQMTSLPPRKTSECIPNRQRKSSSHVPSAGPPCEKCKGPTIWGGTGRKPKWCKRCGAEEKRKNGLRLDKQHTARRLAERQARRSKSRRAA